MSEFSNFCNMLREKSGMTIYYIAKASDMERTALNRMLIGKRIPKYEDVEQFCGVIRANEKEKEHIRELYLMEKMGKKRYENCRYIEKLIHILDQDNEDWYSYETPEQTGKDYSSFAGEKNVVRNQIFDMLEREYRQSDSGKIYTNFPVYDKILASAIRCYENKYEKRIPLHYFHILNINPEQYYDVDCNLKVLYSALLWIFFKERSYIPYYTYSPLMLDDMKLQMMPWYLVTDDRVALISDDFRQGIFLDDLETVSFYQKRMRVVQSQMRELFSICEEPEGAGGENPLYSLWDLGIKPQKLNLELYEKSVVISKYNASKRLKEKAFNIVIRESSLCEAFQDYFIYQEEMRGHSA